MRLFEGTEFDIPPRCETCGSLEDECQCLPELPEAAPPEEQRLTIRLEKRKRGKTVSVVRGLDPTGNHLKDILALLKKPLRGWWHNPK